MRWILDWIGVAGFCRRVRVSRVYARSLRLSATNNRSFLAPLSHHDWPILCPDKGFCLIFGLREPSWHQDCIAVMPGAFNS